MSLTMSPHCEAQAHSQGEDRAGKPSSGAASASSLQADDEDIYDWEVRDSATPFWQHAMAGSCAGIMEHVCMYPVDTIKANQQTASEHQGMRETWRKTWSEGGAPRLMRGSMVIGLACIPAHICFFGTYELGKSLLLEEKGQEHQPLQAAACGAMATIAHDGIITPADVIKQRLQIGKYAGRRVLDCVRMVLEQEGVRAFYLSLPTTLVMNIPYMGLFAAMNESLKRFLDLGNSREEQSSGLAGAPWYFLVAGISGAIASSLTTPLDNVKTKLQTQDGQAGLASGSLKYSGIFSTVRLIAQERGFGGFFLGLGPRIALAMPSAAICWGTYETIRMALTHVCSSDDEGNTQQPLHSLNPRSAGAGAGAGAGASAAGTAAGPGGPGQEGLGRGAPSTGKATAGNTRDSMDSLDWEEWDGSTPFWQHAVAGSCAGMMEHVAMYPVDTVKTRMQAAPADLSRKPLGVSQVVREVLREHGVGGLMRGCMAIGVGCVPAHIALFCTYEFCKVRLMDVGKAEHQPLRAAACGAAATVMHDMIITPTDVVKQRLQLGRYRGTFHCMASMWQHEGLMGFYRSLPTTLISECPFHGVLVASNESLKILLGLEARSGGAQADGQSSVPLGWHFVSSGISGIVAAVITQPLDVVKTRLQTQTVTASADDEVQVRYRSLLPAFRTIHKEEGLPGLFRGTLPRLLFAAPSAAMCWGSYEVTKALLRKYN